jgi:hypothetical protein
LQQLLAMFRQAFYGIYSAKSLLEKLHNNLILRLLLILISNDLMCQHWQTLSDEIVAYDSATFLNAPTMKNCYFLPRSKQICLQLLRDDKIMSLNYLPV